MPTININGRAVGTAETTFVIAEVGINHNGEVARALEVIKWLLGQAVMQSSFRRSGRPNSSTTTLRCSLIVPQGREVTESMRAMFERYELPPDAWHTIKAACVKAGTCFSRHRRTYPTSRR